MDMSRMLGQGEGYEGEQEQEEQGHNPLLVLHLLLQGRYWIACLLAVMFAAAAAVAGFELTHRTFACTGLVQIRPVISSMLFNGGGQMPMYEQFVQTQVMMLKSERCIDMAMNSPRWLAGGSRTVSAEATAEFIKKLDVSKDGEFIRVTFTDPNPETAKDAVGAVIDAYQSLNQDIDPDQPVRKQAKLEQWKADYEGKLETARNDVAKLASPWTPEGLQARYNYKLTESFQAETERRMSEDALAVFLAAHRSEVTLEPDASAAAPSYPTANWASAVVSKALPMVAAALQTAKSKTAPATSAAVAATQSKVYTPEHIAGRDPQMRLLIQSKQNLQGDLDELLTHVGPNNQLAVQLRNKIEILDKRIADYAKNWVAAEATTPGVEEVVANPQATYELLVLRVQVDRVRYKAVSDEVANLGANLAKIQKIQGDQSQNVQWLTETKQALEELRLQNNSTGRILIISMGDRPVLKDKRIPVAAASGFGGAVLGFAIIVVWGLMDRRLRTIDHARMSLKQGMRVLGMLPSLPKNLEDPSAASFAALCVHHIRMLLQVMPRLDGHPAIAITSPSPGDGKTSLTMALALSYAASGKSTLLIDCDIVGAGLTRRVNAIIRRRIGQILIRENLLTAAELREALSSAQRSGRRLGEVLVQEGFVDAEQLEKALKTQTETSVGLLDVMRGEVLEDCVAETGTPRLWILPVGSALAEHGATISPEGFRSVLDQARKRFDVILIDTGPVPGAIESSVAASQADGVVLTVSRGEQGPLVKRAAEHLRDIGGRALGVVFNRASPEDFSSSYASMSKPSIPERVRDKTDVQAIGPVAAAVAGQQRTLKEGKE